MPSPRPEFLGLLAATLGAAPHTWNPHRGDVGDPRLAARRDDAEGEWAFIRPTTTRPMGGRNPSVDLSQTNDLLAGFASPAALPEHRARRVRARAVRRWLDEHHHMGAPRTPPPLRPLAKG